MSAPLIIGTRGSKLALWQAEHIAERLKQLGHPCELKIIGTKGDRIQHIGFDKLEGKGFFTKELEEALLNSGIDLAVHSCKDLETRGPEGLVISAIAGRAACEELMIVRPNAVDRGRALFIRESAVVGTSSARRKAQLKAFRPDVRITDLRGNVPTRVEKLRGGAYDAILLAKAGIDRLGLDLEGLNVFTLDPRWFVPAPAQGALAVQTRTTDERVIATVRLLHDLEAARIVDCERAVLRSYHGGCQVPLGVHVEHAAEGFTLKASAARTASEMPRFIHLVGNDPAALAEEAVQRLKGELNELQVTITRTVHADDVMRRVLSAHGIQLTGVPLFDAMAVPFTTVPQHDRVFFTSRNAVRFFVQGGGVLQDVPCDAIGAGTADEIRKHGAEPDFIGDGPDSPTIALQYAERFPTSRVLFPCAKDGQRTVQRALSAAHAMDLHVYAMQALDPVTVPAGDVLIVTSPDNAAALHAHSALAAVPHLIAMGTSTAQRIHELCGRDAVIPWASNEMALIDAVFTLATDHLV